MQARPFIPLLLNIIFTNILPHLYLRIIKPFADKASYFLYWEMKPTVGGRDSAFH
jgi:hypothetical protein